MKPTENPQTLKATLEGKNTEKTENTQEAICYVTIDETGIHDSPYYE